MILVTEGPSFADPTDLCRISVVDSKGISTQFAVMNPRLCPPSFLFGIKNWWINMYRFTLVALLRRHVRNTMSENNHILRSLEQSQVLK